MWAPRSPASPQGRHMGSRPALALQPVLGRTIAPTTTAKHDTVWLFCLQQVCMPMLMVGSQLVVLLSMSMSTNICQHSCLASIGKHSSRQSKDGCEAGSKCSCQSGRHVAAAQCRSAAGDTHLFKEVAAEWQHRYECRFLTCSDAAHRQALSWRLRLNALMLVSGKKSSSASPLPILFTREH